MSADPSVIVLALVVGVPLVAIALWLRRELRRLHRPDPSTGLLILQSQLDALREQIRASLEGGNLQIDRRLEETNRVVGEVRRGLGEVDRQVRAVGDAARDLRGLQELLRSPKMRGGMGETLLGELLAEVLPQAHFTLQHQFGSGERVDAVLRIGDAMVPVDAKFPLENFQRSREATSANDDRLARESRRMFRADVRRHVDAIAKRYIRPEEGTYEFAMMYIPAESVYQEMLHQEGDDALDLFHYALARRIVPVSPQSFYAYLQVIVLGLRGLGIEARAREIMNRLGLIQNRFDRFSESFDTATRHLTNAQRQVEEASRRLARLQGAIGSLATGSPDEQPEIDSPDAPSVLPRLTVLPTEKP